MRLFSYVVARDYGFAPNPFYGYCTLATCKPEIRNVAKNGDWILGTGSKSKGMPNHAVFAMRVTEVLTFNEYWSDDRFRSKHPNLHGSKKQAFGDNIYHRAADSEPWMQENSHHSHPDGTTNFKNVARDTKYDRVLISDDFVYWGAAGPELPSQFTGSGTLDIRAHRGHKSIFPEALVRDVVDWIRDVGEGGYLGEPFAWQRTP